MHIKPLPPLEVLRELFSYDPKTGTLTWNKNGKIAGSKTKRGHTNIIIKGLNFKGHRICYALHNGLDPGQLLVDHINGDASDNRADNLRLCTHSENGSNRGKQYNNSTGHKGVTQYPDRLNPYVAQIGVDNKMLYLGSFQSLEAAQLAYDKAAKKYHKNFARFN